MQRTIKRPGTEAGGARAVLVSRLLMAVLASGAGFCAKCGTPRASGDRFRSKCGARLNQPGFRLGRRASMASA